ncbi:zinc finger A20 and AN1 domain-containing stress-associated protein 5-like [Rhodamnia argentea]|uniref:Zinc finger A20 and AN1 domain-containing stress-associated protein 5-like n=1 Tax=Rhodamnia argentea TaxID=178133 RepID=A0A8B8MV66_9MYRT|nr:zinc finger A20 and AN1 domain-containing stress-associated protein 5-like [Rhodamnia argentea]XP_030513981.1 zinc finger A20 and AN1 domain-containing stress-associated protein 5-like [Rhodamnia argentea]XP_048131641.1 zinc finger A20 and AN1 domain-containing stress-associated protein 5-like [Rhodamnia argentea]
MDEQSQKRKLRDVDCEQSSSSEPVLCANDCGFFGNPSTNNLCSRCYYEYLLKQPKHGMDSTAVSEGAGSGDVVDGSSCVGEAPAEAVANRAEAAAALENQQTRPADHSGEPSSSNPVLCANNCGFFGNPTTNNLCSKCYCEYLLKQSKEDSGSAAAAEGAKDDGAVDGSSYAEEAPVEAVANLVEEVAASENQETRPVNRCGFCRKRVGLTGFKCKCGETFCSVHRYSDKHECVFNYKTAGRDAIAKANPVVKADKIEKI